MNQPNAALANFQTLAVSCAPLLARGDAEVREAVLEAKDLIVAAVEETWRRKMGFQYPASAERADKLWKEVEPLMRQSQVCLCGSLLPCKKVSFAM